MGNKAATPERSREAGSPFTAEVWAPGWEKSSSGSLERTHWGQGDRGSQNSSSLFPHISHAKSSPLASADAQGPWGTHVAPLPAEPVCPSGPAEKGQTDFPSGPSPSARTPWVRAKSGHCSSGHCNRYQGQGGLQGCLPAACPQQGCKGRCRRLGRRNVLGNVPEWGSIPKKLSRQGSENKDLLRTWPGWSRRPPMCSWATPDVTRPQPAVLPPCSHSPRRDEPGGGCISCTSSNTPEGPVRGHQRQVCGDTVRGFICNAGSC